MQVGDIVTLDERIKRKIEYQYIITQIDYFYKVQAIGNEHLHFFIHPQYLKEVLNG